ncbi:IclR family transcriptional regulator [Brevibacterium sp.]|uniref:IclR family transcriptional regulator n=1 Tax=Brevibacterium sp. TaxID=1701 RepID=UPI002811C171|nr:IclR family transcriptional regulator [Brevibacterium sp.]
MSTVSNRQPRPTLQTVDRALEILLSFNEEREEWGVSELAEEFGLSQSTAQRLLAALADRGFLRVMPYSRRYRLGPTLWRMSALWERTGGLAALADPTLKDLSSRSTRTALFAIPDGTHIRVVAIVDGDNGPLWQHSVKNELYPAHAGAAARGYFAFLDPTERKALLSDRPFGRFSEATTVDRDELEAQFRSAAEVGYAISEGEFDLQTRALAVPVYVGRRPVASLCLIENASAEAAEPLRDLVPLLHEASEALTRSLTQTAARHHRRTPLPRSTR